MRVLENEFQRSNDQMQRLESQTTAIQDVAEGFVSPRTIHLYV